MERFADLEITPRLWELIDAARGDEGAMRRVLVGFSRENLIRFERAFDDAVSDLVYRVIGEHGDAYTEEEIAGWVVSKGLPHYAAVWDHPEQFPPELPDEGASFFGLAGVVFDERFPGQPVTTAEPYRVDSWPKVRGGIVLEQVAGGGTTRLFPIQGYDYETGVCADGRQVILGLLCPSLVAVWFDANGKYLDYEERPWGAAAAELAGREPPYNISGDRFGELIAEQLKAWQAELGFNAATIRVEQFRLPGLGIAIQELPGWALEIETATWLTDAERQEYRKARDQWVADGKFVFWWGRSYHMSRDGEVEST